MTGHSSAFLRLSEAELEATREHVVAFIREADGAGVDRAVLGLSGGIDSTLTPHLAVEALGAAVRGGVSDAPL